jgi:hypothetical protein
MKTRNALLSRCARPHHDSRGNSLAHRGVLRVGAIIAETRRANCEPRLAASGPQIRERGVADEHADVEVFAGDNLLPRSACMRVRCSVPGRWAPDLEQRTFVGPAGGV